MKKILIVGASSGIGWVLAKCYLENGDLVMGCARNEDRLKELEKQYTHFIYEVMDIRNSSQTSRALTKAVARAGGMDLCIISAGISSQNRSLKWDIEYDIIQTNVTGFSYVAVWAAHYFLKQHKGHIAGISSVAKYFGNPNPAYNATKAFEALFLDGLRLALEPKHIFVSTILPGFVDTPMIQNQRQRFWVSGSAKAARQICRGLNHKKRFIFVTRRWKIFSVILPLLPFSFLKFLLSPKR